MSKTLQIREGNITRVNRNKKKTINDVIVEVLLCESAGTAILTAVFVALLIQKYLANNISKLFRTKTKRKSISSLYQTKFCMTHCYGQIWVRTWTNPLVIKKKKNRKLKAKYLRTATWTRVNKSQNDLSKRPKTKNSTESPFDHLQSVTQVLLYLSRRSSKITRWEGVT